MIPVNSCTILIGATQISPEHLIGCIPVHCAQVDEARELVELIKKHGGEITPSHKPHQVKIEPRSD